MKKNELTGSEALYGFGAWLTTREKVSGPFSASHLTPPMAELIKEFCEVNRLTEPRENWTDYLTHPSK